MYGTSYSVPIPNRKILSDRNFRMPLDPSPESSPSQAPSAVLFEAAPLFHPRQATKPGVTTLSVCTRTATAAAAGNKPWCPAEDFVALFCLIRLGIMLHLLQGLGDCLVTTPPGSKKSRLRGMRMPVQRVLKIVCDLSWESVQAASVSQQLVPALGRDPSDLGITGRGAGSGAKSFQSYTLARLERIRCTTCGTNYVLRGMASKMYLQTCKKDLGPESAQGFCRRSEHDTLLFRNAGCAFLVKAHPHAGYLCLLVEYSHTSLMSCTGEGLKARQTVGSSSRSSQHRGTKIARAKVLHAFGRLNINVANDGQAQNPALSLRSLLTSVCRT